MLLSSCTPSLHPLFENDERTFEPELAGVWQDKEGENTFTLRWFPDGKMFSLRTELKEQQRVPGQFNAVFGAVGKYSFLQIVPVRPSNITAKSFYGGHFIQTFSFWKVDLDKDKLVLNPLNYRWVEAMLEAKKLSIKHEQQDGGFIMLTASTEDLKAFVLKYADDKGAFSGGFALDRKK